MNDAIPKLTSNHQYDKERLAELSKLAIGSRTLRAFSNQSGLSEGFLSRLTTGKLLSAPTRRSLSKLTAASSKPQNGISFEDLMEAAGYGSEVSKGRKTERTGGKAVPLRVRSAAFPSYLVASALEATGQLGQRFKSDNQQELFVITSAEHKDIVGLPAFCDSDEVEDEIQTTKRNLLMVYSIFAENIKDKFVVVLTNQPEFYDNFDNARLIGTDGEFHLVLTEDYHSFKKQRPVQTIGLDGKPQQNQNGPVTYDFLEAQEEAL